MFVFFVHYVTTSIDIILIGIDIKMGVNTIHIIQRTVKDCFNERLFLSVHLIQGFSTRSSLEGTI